MPCDVKWYVAFNLVVGSVFSVLSMQRLALERSWDYFLCVIFSFFVQYLTSRGVGRGCGVSVRNLNQIKNKQYSDWFVLCTIILQVNILKDIFLPEKKLNKNQTFLHLGAWKVILAGQIFMYIWPPVKKKSDKMFLLRSEFTFSQSFVTNTDLVLTDESYK